MTVSITNTSDVDYRLRLEEIINTAPPGPLWVRVEHLLVTHKLGWCPGTFPCDCQERYYALRVERAHWAAAHKIVGEQKVKKT